MERYKRIFTEKEKKFNKPVAIKEIFEKLPTKGMREFSKKFSKKEFGDFTWVEFLKEDEFLKIIHNYEMIAAYRVVDRTIYVNEDKMRKDKSGYTHIMLHELAHTRNYRMKHEELVKEIEMMRKILISYNFEGGYAFESYYTDPNIYDLQELHSEIYVRFKMMGKIL